MSSLYFVSLLVRSNSQVPTKISLYDGQTTYEEAMDLLLKTKEKYITFIAWIERYDGKGKEIVFQQCYV